MTTFTTPTKTSTLKLGKTTYTLDLCQDKLGAIGYYLSEEEQGKAPTEAIFLSEQQVKAINLFFSKKA